MRCYSHTWIYPKMKINPLNLILNGTYLTDFLKSKADKSRQPIRIKIDISKTLKELKVNISQLH